MSKLVTTPVSRSGALRKSVLGMAVAAALAMPQLAAAYEFDTGSDAWSFRWDNTLRVNISDRVAGTNKDMIENPNFDDGDRNFEAGSIFTRFDILSEADLVWKPSWGMLGARVSAAGWWNPSYESLDNDSLQTENYLKQGSPAFGLPGYTKRYAEGPSGEFLDWFLFTKFNVGDAPVNIKVGQTTVYWGESLGINGATHGINYGQNPIDVWKGFENPGVEAKEVFRPRLGFNINSQVTDTLYVAGQYFFNWQQFSNQAWRYPDSSSYLSLGDYVLWGARSLIYAPNPLYGYPQFSPPGAGVGAGYPLCALAPLPDGGSPFPNPLGATCAPQQWLRFWHAKKDITPDENSGNYGIALRWAPDWVNGTLGFYYRRSYDMQPQAVIRPDLIPGVPSQALCAGLLGGLYLGGGQCLQNGVATYAPSPPTPVGTPAVLSTTGTQFVNDGRIGSYQFAYGSGIDMFGLSLSKNVGSLSLGAELVYRHDMPLLSDPVQVVPAALRGVAPLAAGRIWSDQVPNNDTPGAKGNTLHGVLNLLGVLGESFWDTASWSAELTWMTYLDVTQNEAVFKGRSNHIVYIPETTTVDTTKSWTAYKLLDQVDKNYFGLAINFTPTWFQVRPGMDMLLPLSWSQGISGNSAITGGGQEGAGTFGLGVALDLYQRYRFDLKYVGFYGEMAKCKNSNGVASFCGGVSPNAIGVFNGTNAILSDRDFVALTFKTTF